MFYVSKSINELAPGLQLAEAERLYLLQRCIFKLEVYNLQYRYQQFTWLYILVQPLGVQKLYINNIVQNIESWALLLYKLLIGAKQSTTSFFGELTIVDTGYDFIFFDGKGMSSDLRYSVSFILESIHKSYASSSRITGILL